MKKPKEKKQQRINDAVSGVISAYRDTGEDTDVLGMYTGIARLSDTGAPTSAVDGGKTYQRLDMHPEQDADDL